MDQKGAKIGKSTLGVSCAGGWSMANIGPQEASSNLAEWFELFGLEKWASSFTPTTDAWVAWISGISFVLVFAIPWLWKRRFHVIKPPEQTPVDYIEAIHIVDNYLKPSLVGKSAGTSLMIKKEMIDRFGDFPGARLSEYEYNRALLHQWLQANAARLLIENRGDLR